MISYLHSVIFTDAIFLPHPPPHPPLKKQNKKKGSKIMKKKKSKELGANFYVLKCYVN